MGWENNSSFVVTGSVIFELFYIKCGQFCCRLSNGEGDPKKFVVVMCVLIPHGYADSMLDRSLRFICTNSKERNSSSEYIIYLTCSWL